MRSRGLTLIEFTVALALLGVAVVAFLGAFAGIQRSVIKTKNRTLATSLCRERMETLKNQRYVLLRPTEQADIAALGYDATHFPPDIGLQAAGSRFDRFSRVDKAALVAGEVVVLPPSAPDAGLKRIVVWVEWKEEEQTRRYEMTSLLNDPNRSRAAGGVTGTVYRSPGGGGNELGGATVRLVEEPARSDVSNAAGAYWISATSGAFTARASARGYFDQSFPVAANPSASRDFTLSQRGTGALEGVAYVRDHLVVSQVVVSTLAPDGFDVQFVELYNPTTAHVFVGSVSSHSVRLQYTSPYLTQDCPDLALEYVATTVAPLSSYLIANASSFVLAGATVTADAYFADSAGAGCAAAPPGWAPPWPRRIMEPGQAGSIVLRRGAALNDAVGWTLGATTPSHCEGSCVPLSLGLGSGEQLVRRVAPGSAASAPDGRAFDVNDNAEDFLAPPYVAGLEAPALASSDGPRAPLTGTPAAGAVVSADDDLSSPVLASATGWFLLPGVATCTALGVPAAWTLLVASGPYAGEVYGAAPPAGGIATVGTLALISTATAALVTGTVVSSVAGPLAGIVVQSGGSTSLTDGSGFYRMLVEPGSVLLTANYGRANPSFETITSSPYTLAAGETLGGANFVLNPVGAIRGAVTTNGVDPLPGSLVRAMAPSATIRGTATTDASGAFRIVGLPASAVGGVGTYTIAPAIDSSQVASPASASVSLSQGAEVDVGTFTVSSAMGLLSGSVSDGGAPITTGVLIMATLATIGATPPTWDESLRGGSTVYYTSHARNDGTWSLPVRVNPGAYNVYAWYSKPDGGVSVTTPKSATQVVDSSSGTFVVPFSWP